MKMVGRAFMLTPALFALALLLAGAGFTVRASDTAAGPPSAPDPFPAVPALRPQVDFWIKVFTGLRQDEVILHDNLYPQLQYEVFSLPGSVGDGLDRTQRRYLDRRREELVRRLLTLERKSGHGETLTQDEQELRHRLEAAGGTSAVDGAAQRVRAQRGLREKFLDGVRRSGRHLEQMRRIFTAKGLPADLAYLPHVESSFDIDARSTAGAAGIWQFTRPTGRRYLHISNALDERLDPIAATRAAADYLASAHDLLDDWALAITAYNHGPTGMLTAARRHGTNLEHIVRDYQADSFGFASRNFYTEFLAVRTILNQPEQYLDTLPEPDEALRLRTLRLPAPSSAPRLARLLDTELDVLAAVNPAWLDRTLQGRVSLPAGTEIRLPAGVTNDDGILIARLDSEEPGAPPLPVADAETYRVRNGDTLGAIARQLGVSLSALRKANGIKSGSHLIRAGQHLKVPEPRTGSQRASAPATGNPVQHSVRKGENPFVIARRYKVPLNSLLAANGLDTNAVLRPGQRLRIPATATP